MLRRFPRFPKLSVRAYTSNGKPENIGLTGVARIDTAKEDLLSAYSSFSGRLDMSSLPDSNAYKSALRSYLGEAVSMLRSEHPEELQNITGMQYEELLIECVDERDLLEAMEDDSK